MDQEQEQELKYQFSLFWTAQAGRITGEYGSINSAHKIYNSHKVRTLISEQNTPTADELDYVADLVDRALFGGQ